MESTIQLIDLLGAAALLLWGLRMIKTGIMRAFGGVLRNWIARGTRNRIAAAFWGFMATLGLQSSTATATIIGAFTARDIVHPRMAQAMMLGANLGTAVVAVLLSADVHWFSSVLILIGVVAFNASEAMRMRNVGRALLGLGLMLLALQLLGNVIAPLRGSEVVQTVLAALDDAPVFAVLLAALLAIVGSSSLAVVVLVMMLAAADVVSPPLALYLVVGANFGGAVPPYLAVYGEGLAARRLTLANMLVRGVGALIVMVLAVPFATVLTALVPDAAQRVVAAHVAFNLALLILFLPLIGPVARLAEVILPEKPDSSRTRPSYLDDSLLPLPEMALAVAARETLMVGDIVAEMLDRSYECLSTSDELPCATVPKLEAQVDTLHQAIKLYVARLSQTEMGEGDARRASEVISYAINLEHIGDIVESGLADIAVKKARKNLSFSTEGMAELAEFYLHTRENLRMAQAIFLSRDEGLARQLVDRKVLSRKLEAVSAERHLQRVRDRRVEALETSTIHLDVLRDLKRINAHLASVSYPILENLGLLRESRLRSDQPKPATVG